MPNLPQERLLCRCVGFCSKAFAESQPGVSVGGSGSRVSEICECHAGVMAGSIIEADRDDIQSDYYGALDHPVSGLSFCGIP